MVTTFIPQVLAKYIETTAAVQYTTPPTTLTSQVAVLDAYVVVNTGTVTALLDLWIVASGDAPSDSNLLVDQLPIGPGEPGYPCAEVIGQVLLEGAALYARSSVASTLVLAGSGRLIAE